jgi:hypothetical protein
MLPSRSIKYVGSGSWLCKNAKTINRDRRNYSSKTALVAQLASELNLEVELKNIILVAFRFFEFLHSQGHTRPFFRRRLMSGYEVISAMKSGELPALTMRPRH